MVCGGDMARKPISAPSCHRAGTISRLTKWGCGGSLHFLIRLGGVWMSPNHTFLGCANRVGTIV